MWIRVADSPIGRSNPWRARSPRHGEVVHENTPEAQIRSEVSPERLCHVGTFFGASAIVEKVELTKGQEGGAGSYYMEDTTWK